MDFEKKYWRTFDEAITREYLITNGLGSFCSSTIIGANIRKYHGLLNASLQPPVNRVMLLSKLDEKLLINNNGYALSSNEFVENKEEGYIYLTKFTNDLIPKFLYKIGDITIEKQICMEYRKNTVVVVYKINTGNERVKMEFSPYVNFRDHHEVSKKGDFEYKQDYQNKILNLEEKESKLRMKIISNCNYHKKESWTKPIYFRNEAERGLSPIDVNFIPGVFEYEMEAKKDYIITFTVTIENNNNINPLQIIENEKQRKKQLLDKAGFKDTMLKELVLGADQFIVDRYSTKTKTIIAGYPWFTDWGRDTMIAFTGLTLVTGRFKDAKNILLTFVKYLKDGLIPNMFPDENNEPMYNTVDGTLWFFYAVYKYLEYTKDSETIKNEIYPHLKSILEHHINGTSFDISMDKDGLLTAGTTGTQLTWMDVKVGDWVVTPRHGKAVEINALWYNAIKTMEMLSIEFKDEYKNYSELAEKIKKSFLNEFWNYNKMCLYDVIQEGEKIDKMRPNQIISVSLPYIMLDKIKSKNVVDNVYKYLYTSYGLRSLSKTNTEYIGSYIGDVYKRDGAYHQGTVWAWLIGPFVEAYAKVNNYSHKSKKEVRDMLRQFQLHMRDSCIGNISEIFDGNEPFKPRGCMAQAWSVSEVLRTYVEILEPKKLSKQDFT